MPQYQSHARYHERTEQYCLHVYSILLMEKYFVTGVILLTLSAKLPSQPLAPAAPRTRWSCSCCADALPLRGCGSLGPSASSPAGGELGLPRTSLGGVLGNARPASPCRRGPEVCDLGRPDLRRSSADLAAVSPLAGMRTHAGKAERRRGGGRERVNSPWILAGGASDATWTPLLDIVNRSACEAHDWEPVTLPQFDPAPAPARVLRRSLSPRAAAGVSGPHPGPARAAGERCL
ncbi:uncharacterized protein LOC111524987 [Piliocolobus tephrosceles]|uniref:uncharacterized protein LOC111524987 n=1 Tax=Piliocolobus tephrosceles TaxID=591936 RepID=UPI000C2ACEDA|nr:uncharacterized protein LOC111524987 [Piliocolobus tephrosceles]